MHSKFNWFALSDGRMLKCDGLQIIFANHPSDPEWTVEAKTATAMHLQWAFSICRGGGSDPLAVLEKLLPQGKLTPEEKAEFSDRWRLAMYAWELSQTCGKLTVEGMPIVV
jgi:hypothetical protein